MSAKNNLRYPDTPPGMSIDDFRKWIVTQLKEFLGDRGINRDGLKEKLVTNAYAAYTLGIPAENIDAQTEEKQVIYDYKKKLVLENGMVLLPDPRLLIEGWVCAPLNLPDTTYEQVTAYLANHDAGKAYKGGKSLLESGHISNVMTHSISANIRYCFVRGMCCPEQKQSRNDYDVWLCLHKDTGEILTADCKCTAGASGVCKHAGALMWYIEKEVKLGTNKTCTEKTQKWSIPSKKQMKLHTPEVLSEIVIKKPKVEKVYGDSKSQHGRANFDPRAIRHRTKSSLTQNDIDTLAELTNGNCGLVMLMREEADHSSSDVASFIEVETSAHVGKPKTISEICLEIGECSFETFIKAISISADQQHIIQKMTHGQSSADTKSVWQSYRNGRITASIIKDVITKVNNDMQILNPTKSKSLLSNILGYYPNYQSKSTTWGINNESVARSYYEKSTRKDHRKLSVSEGGFFIDLTDPFLGASPDGLVSCLCHGEGLVEIKCPWTYRDLTIAEYAEKNESCLEKDQKGIKLKRKHSYFFQVQCQMHVTQRKWCDFFLCTTKDSHLERIPYDNELFMQCIEKSKVVYKELVMPELFTRQLQSFICIEKDVKIVVSSLVNKASM